MKSCYIKDLLRKRPVGQEVEILGWIASKRDMGRVIFLDLTDSSGKIQTTVNQETGSAPFLIAKKITPESSVRVKGTTKFGPSSIPEIEVKEIEVIGDTSLQVTPQPRSHFDIFDQRFVDLILAKRHLYLRNEKLMAVLKFRHLLVKALREWFCKQDFIEIHAPILTQVPLYQDTTLFELEFFTEKVFLTQCVAFYLESAIHAFEKVYNISPSFRAEKSKDKRHLAEFWHVKAEIAFSDLKGIMTFAENMISYVVRKIVIESRSEIGIIGANIDTERLTNVPYPRITYDEALDRLKAMDKEKRWGKSLSGSDLASLSEAFDTPFWITGNPRNIEPFPYKIDSSNPRVSKTADLIAPDGFGELLGVAEKIWRLDELLQRMKEKGKEIDERYKWYCELREFGSIPHCGLGMGIERVIRWLLKLRHVRDAIPFPRMYGRSPNP